jgi:starch synthase
MSTKILFINTDIVPYIPEGRMAVIGRQLAQGMQEKGHEIRTFMPRFGRVSERRCQLHEVIRLSGMNLIIDDTDHPLIIKVASIQPARMQVYFIDNDDYFTSRKMSYADGEGNEYEDNGERMVFFARGVIETIRKLRWTPDVVYCQGWFTSVAPIYIKRAFNEDACFKRTKVVFAAYDNMFQTPIAANFTRLVQRDGITKSDLKEWADKKLSCVEVTRMALKYSDGLVITDPNIDPALLAQAEKYGLKVLDCSKDTELNLDKYHEFFEQFAQPEQ